ncbi:MAG: hypothetical protein K2L46_03220 [Paramuribaculum sp.]|nr:hypothetical protein [Paramuribaculum sp.]MDE6323623.1 hypothetical protein [Paramuribaculum sp.]MDE6488267.1 hypothetical protein [Paramuribaculum sp.]
MNHHLATTSLGLTIVLLFLTLSACNNKRAIAKVYKPVLYSNNYSPYSTGCKNNIRLSTDGVYLVTKHDSVFTDEDLFYVLEDNGVCWMSENRSGIYQVVGDSIFMQFYYVGRGRINSGFYQYWDVGFCKYKIIDSLSFKEAGGLFPEDEVKLKPFVPGGQALPKRTYQFYKLKYPIHLNSDANILNQKWIWRDKKEWKAWKKAQKAKKKKRISWIDFS